MNVNAGSAWSSARAPAVRASGHATLRKSTLKSMRAIARSTGILACVGLCCLWADAHDDIIELFANVANALSTVNPPKFMDSFDKNMPDSDKLKSEAAPLVNQTEITSSLHPL